MRRRYRRCVELALVAIKTADRTADKKRVVRTDAKIAVELDQHFRAALDGHTHQARIRDDVAAADATGAQIGTPAFFIAGKFVAGALPFEEFQRRIDAALAAAH